MLKRIGRCGYAVGWIARWGGVIALWVGGAVCAWGTGVEILNLPDDLDAPYDLTWTMTRTASSTVPFILEVETPAHGPGGYRLTMTTRDVCWISLARPSLGASVTTALPSSPRRSVCWTLKRRPDTLALLCEHRLVLTVPMPTAPTGTLRVPGVPAGVTLGEVRYQPIEPPRFGDDFMRPEALERFLAGQTGWLEDTVWETAFYRIARPAAHPRDPRTGEPMTNPWQLSLYPTVETTTNGFWFLYTGVGPSWVLANPSLFYAFRDRYSVQAAVKPEYDSAVGLIAAYQDDRNYLLFRWRANDYRAAAATPRAELIATIDGTPHVLASSPRGCDPEQWYTVRINLGWQRVQALVDGAVLLDAPNPGSVEGRVGLYADGVAAPRRPKLDDLTATMYVTEDTTTGRVVNDAAEALRSTSCIYFDDVQVRPWDASDDLLTAAYQQERTGTWTLTRDGLRAGGAGRLVSGSASTRRYTLQTRLRLPANGRGGLFFHLDAYRRGYAWLITPTGQQLQPLNGDTWLPAVDRATVAITPGDWMDLRVVADDAYVACYCNGTRVLEAYDPARIGGRAGIWSATPDLTFTPVVQSPLEAQWNALHVHPNFDKDKWLVTWSGAEADWYPAFTPRAYITPAGLPHETIGAAAPLPTDQAGLYWHKGGHYHDLRVTIPVTPTTVAEQVVHLTSGYDATGGYRVVLHRDGAQSAVQLWRRETLVGSYPCTVTTSGRILVERHGAFLLLRCQSLDPDDQAEDPEVLADTLLTAYRDPHPLPASQIGFTVTVPQLPASVAEVLSDRLQDTFEQAPVGWVTQSGVWAVTARYACQPKWNWFGGFGAGTPTVWSKYRLDGDQTVEAYLGIKMQYDNAPEEYARRYRDVNVTICADGAQLNTGYSLIRGGRPGGEPVTMLLRKNTVVWSSTDPAHLLPPQGTGHRQWFATRLEKQGAAIRVFLDNRLVTTYIDPDPLPGGYAACWTLNNGIMLGRANLSAERMTLGTPRAAAPLAIQDSLAPRTVPPVTVNGQPVSIATFENGLDGWTERGGWSARLVRERTTDPRRGPNTVLALVNPYPAGDAAATIRTTPCDLAATPLLHLDYCADPGVTLHLYLRQQAHWYVCQLNTTETAYPTMESIGHVAMCADGQWHHLAVDLGALFRDGVTKQTGTPPASLVVDELVLANWDASPQVRAYGFGTMPGGLTLRVDNVVFTPRWTGPLTVSWAEPTGRPTRWRYGIDADLQGMLATETAETTLTVSPAPQARYLHLQGQEPDGTWGAVVHLPLTAFTDAGR